VLDPQQCSLLLLESLLSFNKLFSQMAFPVKQVQTLEERLWIIEEVDKNPSEKGTDVAK
jgi:hypothetical protein